MQQIKSHLNLGDLIYSSLVHWDLVWNDKEKESEEIKCKFTTRTNFDENFYKKTLFLALGKSFMLNDKNEKSHNFFLLHQVSKFLFFFFLLCKCLQLNFQ